MRWLVASAMVATASVLVSTKKFKDDIGYLDQAALQRLHDETLQMRLRDPEADVLEALRRRDEDRQTAHRFMRRA